ncbi:hypothetical protein K8R78_06465 [bacterium]|nr:hypothetical protein [bacterium]
MKALPTIFLTLLLLIVGCNGKEPPPTEEFPTTAEITAELESTNDFAPDHRISPWNWTQSPVISLEEPELYLGFSFTNSTDEAIGANELWGSSRLTLRRVHAPDYILDIPLMEMMDDGEISDGLAPGEQETMVGELCWRGEFEEQGMYHLVWESPFGQSIFGIIALPEMEYLLYRLDSDPAYNSWGLYMYGMDGVVMNGLGRRVIDLGEAMLPDLIERLDDERECFIEGSEEATIGSMYAHRVCDYAAIMITRIARLDIPKLRGRSAEDRQPGIETVQEWCEENL